MEQLHAGLAELASYNQFILWKVEYEFNVKQGIMLPVKKPKDPRTGANADAHDPGVWTDFETAQRQAKVFQCEVGFVLTTQDPFFFLDIDDCIDTQGVWSPTALSLVNDWTPGACVEVSWSARGLHVLGTGTAPTDRMKKCKAFNWDLYTELRFIALTNNVISGDIATQHTPNITELALRYLEKSGEAGAWTTEPQEDWCGPEDDDELIDMMLKSQKSGASMYGDKATVVDLWEANADALGKTYPHDQGLHPFDHSEADQALIQHLAFWTGKNGERMDRIFRRSGLMRDKWDERDAYRESTVCNGIGWGKKVLQSKKYAKPTSSDSQLATAGQDSDEPRAVEAGKSKMSAEVRQRAGAQFLGIEEQKSHFKGCVYVAIRHEVYTPDGSFLKPETFKVVYGGYLFVMDGDNQDISKNAWEAFTCSRVLMWPKVHRTCFRPEIPQNEIINEDGWLLLNTYIEIKTPRAVGDVSLFTTHMSKLFPDPADYNIMLSYMAALIQHKGKKFTWCPVIQGAEGNGKSLLIDILSFCIGNRYTHLPNSKELGEGGAKFNEWLFDRVFIGIEEIYIGDRRDVADALKSLVTNKRIEKQGKGANQIMGDNRANFLMLTNHKEAVRKTRNDRRYAVFYTPQQSLDDILRDGMDEAYFTTLFDWLEDGGYAIINEYLSTVHIPNQLNPAVGCHRAPDTSSTREAYTVSLGTVEHEILESVQSSRAGFRNGWISSKHLDDLLQEKRYDRMVPRNKRTDVLATLGYVPHPGLQGGRIATVSTVDGSKSRLYVKQDSPLLLNLTGPRAILEVYEKAQTTNDTPVPAMPGTNVVVHS